MKRIMFISDHASPIAAPGSTDCGGQNVYVAEVAVSLAALGNEVDIFTRRDDASLPEVVHWKKGIRVIHVDAGPAIYIPKEELLPYMDKFAEDMILFMIRHRLQYDLIHAHFFMSGLVAARVKAFSGIPFGITFHALGLVRKKHQKEMDRFPQERIPIEKMLVKEADFIIAECPQDRLDLIHDYAADPAKIRIVPCGFSAREFYPVNKSEARRRLGLDKFSKVILQLGRMVPRKGIDNVIRAMGELVPKMPSLKLVIVGGENTLTDSEEWKRLKSVSKAAGVEDAVIFTGRQSRDMLRYYYSAADLFITTPWYEPFGITPLEAMACGTPVIGSAVGGIQYTVKDGVTGYLVPPKDPAALAFRIGKLLNAPDMLRQMSARCILRVNKKFTWAQVAEKMLKAYQYCLLQHAQATVVKKPSFFRRSVIKAMQFGMSKPAFPDAAAFQSPV